MRTDKFLICGMILLGAAAGCSREAFTQAEENEGSILQSAADGETADVVLDLIMPDGGTKTIMGAKSGSSYPVYWQTGDKVTLNGVLSGEVPDKDNGTNKTTLNVKDASLKAPFNVLYPGEAGVTDKVTFPSTQNYTEGSFEANALPMYATASNLTSGFTMNYLGAVLRIPVKFTSETTLKQVILTTVNGEPLGGTFTVGNTSGALNGELSSYSTLATIYYQFGNDGTTFEANETGVFCIAIPKGTYEKGIEAKMYDMDGNYMKVSLFTQTTTVDAGKVYEFAQRAFNPDGTAFFISTVEDLQNFALRRGGDKFSLLEAFVVNDIDMTGKEYKADNFNFYGTLDGGNHIISGLTKPLFNNLKGSVKNLTINSSITNAVEDGCNGYGLGILARYAYVSSSDDDAETGDYGQVIEGVTTRGSITVPSHEVDHDFSIGGMLGANKGIPMNSCVNEASVSVSGITPSTDSELAAFRAGGLVGSAISADADISGCSNTGAVNVDGVTMVDGSGIVGIGGLVGYVTKDNTVGTSTNSGAVSVNNITSGSGNAPYLMVGGVVGNVTVSSGFKISDCENLSSGTITLGTSCNVQSARVGGVIGRIGSAGTTVKDCVNRAALDVKASSMSSTPTYGGVVGVVLADEVNLDGCKNYGQVKNAARRLDAIGGVVGYHSGTGAITGCENHAVVASTAVPTIDQYYGGIIGKKAADKKIEFSNCTNEGDVSVTCNSGHTVNIHMGGIIGGCPGGSSTFSNCNNSGDITNNSTKSSNDPHHNDDGTEKTGSSFTPAVSIGGIIGRITDNKVSSITACTNSGNINNNCAATEIRLGGIVGYAHQAIDNLSGCTNSGVVSNNVLADYCYIHVAGILGYTNNKVTMPSTNTNTGKIQNNPSSRVNICDLAEGSYDDNVRLGGCIGSHYYNTSESAFTNQINEGEIVNTGTESCGWVYMGGLQGYAKNIKYTAALNKGYIHNEATVRERLLISGILGRGDADKVDSSQKQAKIQSQSSNEGDVFNNGISNVTLIAGLCAEVQQSTDISNSVNKGTIKNTGTATTARIGGVCAYTNDAYVNLGGSSNEGNVIFEGTTSNAVFMAGGIGYQYKRTTSLVKNMTNSGTISCNVDVPGTLQIAGIVAEADGEVSGCTNSGQIIISGSVGKNLYASGICGYNGNNKPMSNCENLAGGTITMNAGLTVTGQIFCGGILGGEVAGKGVTHSGFINRAAINFGTAKTERIIADNNKYSHIGGCVGGNENDTSNTYEDMENYGNIKYYGQHKCRIGGCVAYAHNLSGTLINNANIKYQMTDVNNGNSRVGGIAGYTKTTTIVGAINKGNLDTYDCKARALTGGIVGEADDVTLFKGCKYQGDLRGTSTGASAGTMCCVSSTGCNVSFEDCVVGSSTRWYSNKTGTNAYAKVTALVKNYSNSDSNSTCFLCGSGNTDTNGSSSGTMTNCTIGSID